MSDPSTRNRVIARRAKSVPAVMAVAVLLTIVFIPLTVLLVIVDLIRLRRRLPLARLVAFGWCWAWLETLGILGAAGLWLTGQRRNLDAHYALQRWWAGRLMSALRATCGVQFDIRGAESFGPGPIVLLVRHASLADSLLTAWTVAEHAGRQPRVVLKQELLADPCLDIVGHRLPNCFVDRDADDATPTLAAIEEMGATMDERSVAIIFPEGTRSNPKKRARALAKIGDRDPQRAQRLAHLQHLIPPRPAGSRALLLGGQQSGAGVVVGTHQGFDGLDTFGGILAALARPSIDVRVQFERIDVPTDLEPQAFERWLDDLWLRIDDEIDQLAATPAPMIHRAAS